MGAVGKCLMADAEQLARLYQSWAPALLLMVAMLHNRHRGYSLNDIFHVWQVGSASPQHFTMIYIFIYDIFQQGPLNNLCANLGIKFFGPISRRMHILAGFGPTVILGRTWARHGWAQIWKGNYVGTNLGRKIFGSNSCPNILRGDLRREEYLGPICAQNCLGPTWSQKSRGRISTDDFFVPSLGRKIFGLIRDS